MQDPFAFKLLSVAKPGIFLGAPIDGGLTNLPTVFSVVASVSAHLIKMTRQQFDSLWQTNTQATLQMTVLSNFELFRMLTAQTQHLIAFEAGIKHTFSQGQIMKQFSQRSPWNEEASALYLLYNPMISILGEEERA